MSTFKDMSYSIDWDERINKGSLCFLADVVGLETEEGDRAWALPADWKKGIF